MMFGSELMELVRKDPKKYEGKRYSGSPIMTPDGDVICELNDYQVVDSMSIRRGE